MKRAFTIILVSAALLQSCVYEFKPDIPEVTENLVIEGDILVGAETTVKLSYLAALDQGEIVHPSSADVTIEQENGGSVTAEWTNVGKYTADTRNLDVNAKYRLHVRNNDNGREYATPYMEVHHAAKIDSLSFAVDSLHEQMKINLSVTSTAGERYYRWLYHEDWEYTTFFMSRFVYVPGRRIWDLGEIEVMEGNNYFCWDYADSYGILLGNSSGLSDEKLVNHTFQTIARTDYRIMDLYCCIVTLESISEECHDYWSRVKQNSNYSGSLTEPSPSATVGNIANLNDPHELVMGYINVSTVCMDTLFVDIQQHHYFKETRDFVQPEYVAEKDWAASFKNNLVPVRQHYSMGLPDGYEWAPKRCVDCTYYGATKNKPSYWPRMEF